MRSETLAPAATGAARLRRQFETPLVLMVGAAGLVLLVAWRETPSATRVSGPHGKALS